MTNEIPEELKPEEKNDAPVVNKEEYAESLKIDVENKAWAERFSKSQDWKKLAGFITQSFPKTSPYSMDNLVDIAKQGGFIAGLTLPERILLTLINKGTESAEELKNNPDAEA